MPVVLYDNFLVLMLLTTDQTLSAVGYLAGRQGGGEGGNNRSGQNRGKQEPGDSQESGTTHRHGR